MSEFTDPIDRRTEALQKSLATATRRNKRQAVTIATLRKALVGLMEAIKCASPDYGEDMDRARAALGNSSNAPGHNK